MSQQLLAKNITGCVIHAYISLVRPSGGLRLVADKTTKKKIKPRVDYESRSAHGRAVNNFPHVYLVDIAEVNCFFHHS